MNTEMQAFADLVVRKVSKMLAAQSTVTPEYLTTEEAATYLSLSAEQLEQWRSHGGGPEYHKLARVVRYRRADIDAWMADRRRSHTAQDR